MIDSINNWQTVIIHSSADQLKEDYYPRAGLTVIRNWEGKFIHFAVQKKDGHFGLWSNIFHTFSFTWNVQQANMMQ